MTENPALLNIDDHIRLALADVHPELERNSYPLFAVDHRERPDLYATCVILECDQIPFLVTAAHAVDQITRTGSGVCVGAKQIVGIPGEFVTSSDDGRDPLDIAVIAIPDALLTSQEIQVVPMARTTYGRDFPNYHFRCIHGYPCTKNKQGQRIDTLNKVFTKYALTCAGGSRQPVDWQRFGKDPATHLAIRYEAKLSLDEDGNEATAPEPKGMSGGGAWLVPDSLNATKAYLEGISIEYHSRDSLVFATRIEQVIAFIREHAVTKL
jgi:hypothetical protein